MYAPPPHLTQPSLPPTSTSKVGEFSSGMGCQLLYLYIGDFLKGYFHGDQLILKTHLINNLQCHHWEFPEGPFWMCVGFLCSNHPKQFNLHIIYIGTTSWGQKRKKKKSFINAAIFPWEEAVKIWAESKPTWAPDQRRCSINNSCFFFFGCLSLPAQWGMLCFQMVAYFLRLSLKRQSRDWLFTIFVLRQVSKSADLKRKRDKQSKLMSLMSKMCSKDGGNWDGTKTSTSEGPKLPDSVCNPLAPPGAL